VHLEDDDADSVKWENFYPALAPAYTKTPE
jgi:hypothetical protein